MNEAKQNENPLISNRKLRHLYTKIVEARIFDEHLTRLQRRAKPATRLASMLGQEACRVSTLIDLKAGDLVSDITISPVTHLILGAEVRPLLQRTFAHPRTKQSSVIQQDNIAQLPSISDGRDRLRIAMGAALALKTAKPGNVVVAFVNHRELEGGEWKKVLTLARSLELPIIFVVLSPASNKKKASTTLVCDKARLAGIPGIPVDSRDAVALFRVAQESLGRTRGGDGPVLIECLTYRLPGHSTRQDDPITQMRKFLLERKVSDQAALDAIGKNFLQKLKQSKH